LAIKVALWLMRAPFFAMRSLARAIARSVGAWVLATTDAVVCPGCGGAVSLVGRWQCGWCSYVFDGFAFARCEICGAVPPFIDCQACGASVMNPTFFR
jgi:hypothetical protein